jgi:hypothetical protein
VDTYGLQSNATDAESTQENDNEATAEALRVSAPGESDLDATVEAERTESKDQEISNESGAEASIVSPVGESDLDATVTAERTETAESKDQESSKEAGAEASNVSPAGESDLDATVTAERTEATESKDQENADEAGAETPSVSGPGELDSAVAVEADITESAQSDDREKASSGNLLDQASEEEQLAAPSAVEVESGVADDRVCAPEKLEFESMSKAKEQSATNSESSPTSKQQTEEPDSSAVAKSVDQSAPIFTETETLRDKEYALVGAEVYFSSSARQNYGGWDNLRFMAYSGTRKVRFCENVSRFIPGQGTLFWSGDQYVQRKLAIYDEPNIILILRSPDGLPEMREILGLPVGAKVEDPKSVARSYLVVESVIDPSASKLRLSPLTTVTSFLSGVREGDLRRKSCFEIMSPMESSIISAVQLRKGAERVLTSFADSGAFLETSSAEHALRQVICKSNEPGGGLEDLSWKHQVILGTLHSFVVLANQADLDQSIAAAMKRARSEEPSDTPYLDPRVVDEHDESGRTALHYACSTRFASAVASLVGAGANVDIRIEPSKMTLCHICAMNLDDRSLSTILEKNRRPNVLDSLGHTPMSLAVVEGRTVNGQRNADLLERCLAVLDTHGGDISLSRGQHRHLVSYVSSIWQHEELAAVLKHVDFRYPILPSSGDGSSRIGISADAFFQYPVHSCLVTFRNRVDNHIKASISGNRDEKWDRVVVETSVLA